jgi:hypothetical protein
VETKLNFVAWCKLLILEQKLNFGAFGRYNRYRRWCLERNAKSAAEKLAIANEVLNGPSVSTREAQANELYLQRAKASGRREDTVIQDTPALPSPVKRS